MLVCLIDSLAANKLLCEILGELLTEVLIWPQRCEAHTSNLVSVRPFVAADLINPLYCFAKLLRNKVDVVDGNFYFAIPVPGRSLSSSEGIAFPCLSGSVVLFLSVVGWWGSRCIANGRPMVLDRFPSSPGCGSQVPAVLAARVAFASAKTNPGQILDYLRRTQTLKRRLRDGMVRLAVREMLRNCAAKLGAIIGAQQLTFE